MDSRIVEFIAALRGAGVRVSVAESADALRALDQIDISERELVRAALQAVLIKDAQNAADFARLFPLYFGTGSPPLMPPGGGDGELSEQQRQQLQQMIEQMLRTMTPQQLAQLFRAMMTGEQPGREQLRQLLASIGQPRLNNPYYQQANTRRALNELQFDQLEQQLQELLEQLRQQGFSEQQLEQIEQQARENQRALAQQIGQQVGQGMAERQNEDRERRRPEELLERPFEQLSHQDIDDLRQVVQRLAQQLRTRAALRQRRGKTGQLDAKATIRANQRFGGVPLDVRHRRRHLKPKLTVVVDISTSMRPVARFMLMLVYALQDQISRTRSFAFNADLEDISTDFNDARPEQAIDTVLERIRPGYYATDLGNSLGTFCRDHLGCVDRRTTFLVLGDGRNNYNDPNLAAFQQIKRRARRLIWFNPESRRQWGSGDSDMLQYAPLCDAVHPVANLKQLAEAIDRLMAAA